MIVGQVRLDRVDFGSVVVTPRTEWTFARLRDVGGAEAEVELTAGDTTAEVVELVAQAVASLRGAASGDPRSDQLIMCPLPTS